MADDTRRTLVCLIEGDSSLFSVKAAGNMPILKLNDLIVEKRQNGVLKNVDAADMRLWKVSMSMASDSTTHSPAG